MPFPGTAALLPADDQRRAPRPRPLFIDKPLSILAKEDNATYSLFVEGVAHLAYDVAWACLSQGVSIGEKKSCEDVCCIGRNLYNLLIGNQRVHHQAGARNGLNDIIGVNVGGGTGDAAAATNWMGRFSHGTAHTFLGGSEGSELVHSFRLPAPIKIADKLKKKLLTSDASVPEWEILDDEAWAVEEDGLEDGVLVSTQNRQGTGQRRRSFGSESVMTVRTTKEEERRPGLSTWTKIRRDR